MKHWTHEEMHALMIDNPIFKDRSDKIHSAPDSVLIDDWYNGKKQMMTVYADAVGCSRITDALAFLEDVFTHIKKNCRTKQEWHALPSTPETSGVISRIAKAAADSRICHSPGGNDYICFCDEKTA